MTEPDRAAVRWSVQALDVGSGEVIEERTADSVVPTASVGKIFLLLEVARQLADGDVDPDEPLSWTDEEWVADSGLWYRMRTRTLGVADLATQIGSVSDNLATNVLLREVGLDRVQQTAREVGCTTSTLLDRVRDVRLPEHPPTLSIGSAAELSLLMARLHRGELISPAVSAQVRSWLAANTDLSMVAAAFALDPLAHDDADRGLTLINKTGTISTARADVGVLAGPARVLAYAALAAWEVDPGHAADPRDEVLAEMTTIGRHLREQVRSS